MRHSAEEIVPLSWDVSAHVCGFSTDMQSFVMCRMEKREAKAKAKTVTPALGKSLGVRGVSCSLDVCWLRNETGIDEGKKKKKKKRGGGIGPRKKETGPTKVVISKTNRNKRKFVTSVIGLETVPDLKVKNAAKLLGRHFACGASASETPSGAQEVVIQGDVMFDLPDVLVNQLNVSADLVIRLAATAWHNYDTIIAHRATHDVACCCRCHATASSSRRTARRRR